jgi:hypothetical protein
MIKNYSHVYILRSVSDPTFIKVGKASNLTRVPELQQMGYANVTDWEQVFTVLAHSPESACKIEGLLSKKLKESGVWLGNIRWNDIYKKRAEQGAIECYRESINTVISLAIEMANQVYNGYIEDEVRVVKSTVKIVSSAKKERFKIRFDDGLPVVFDTAKISDFRKASVIHSEIELTKPRADYLHEKGCLVKVKIGSKK